MSRQLRFSFIFRVMHVIRMLSYFQRLDILEAAINGDAIDPDALGLGQPEDVLIDCLYLDAQECSI